MRYAIFVLLILLVGCGTAPTGGEHIPPEYRASEILISAEEARVLAEAMMVEDLGQDYVDEHFSYLDMHTEYLPNGTKNGYTFSYKLHYDIENVQPHNLSIGVYAAGPQNTPFFTEGMLTYPAEIRFSEDDAEAACQAEFPDYEVSLWSHRYWVEEERIEMITIGGNEDDPRYIECVFDADTGELLESRSSTAHQGRTLSMQEPDSQ